MFELEKISPIELITVFISVTTTIGVFIFYVGRANGCFIEHDRRITSLEKDRKKVYEKLDTIGNSVARIEGMLKK